MLKIKYILISLVSLIFISCEEFFLYMNNVHCEIDKSTSSER
ncbi:MAG: hypothetical protein SO116_02775 [Treponema sp.]|nr:hypothetical protein [Treponema sp.]